MLDGQNRATYNATRFAHPSKLARQGTAMKRIWLRVFRECAFGKQRRPLPRSRGIRLSVEPLEDRTLPATLSILGGVLTYSETSGINHDLTVTYRVGAPGTYVIMDNENFT